MRSVIFVFVCILICTPLSIAVHAETPSSDIVDIGIILPLTGDGASIAHTMKNAIQLAMEKVPSVVKDKMRLTFEDDGLQAKNSVTAFNHLSALGKLDVLINVSSGTGNALAPLAEKKRVPFLAIASDPKISAHKSHVFNFWVTPDEEVRIAIPEAQKRGYRKIARIFTTHDGAFAITNAFDNQNKDALEIVIDENYPLGIKDFRPFLSKIRQRKDIDAIMVVLLPGQCGTFAKQAREQGVTLPLFGFELFEDLAEVKASQNTLVGQWYVSADDPDNEFWQEYHRRFPDASFFIAGNAYDALMLIAEAISHGFTGKNMQDYFASVKDFKGVVGTFSAAPGNTFSLPAAIKVVKSDGFEKLYK